MPLFSRKPAVSDQSSNPQPAPLVQMEHGFAADDTHLAKISDLMTVFSQADGDTKRILECTARIAAVAGLNSNNVLRNSTGSLEETTNYLQRPWRMLGAVATKAAADGDRRLAGKVFAFVFMWYNQIQPQLDGGAVVVINMEPSIPEEILLSIAEAAFRPLMELPPDQIVFSNQTGTVTAGGLTACAATTILHVHSTVGLPVSDELLATAREVEASFE
jgi:hypothetical protein